LKFICIFTGHSYDRMLLLNCNSELCNCNEITYIIFIIYSSSDRHVTFLKTFLDLKCMMLWTVSMNKTYTTETEQTWVAKVYLLIVAQLLCGLVQLLLVFLFDQLLSNLDFFQGNSLSRPSCLSYAFCVSFPLCFWFFISYWWHKWPETYSKLWSNFPTLPSVVMSHCYCSVFSLTVDTVWAFRSQNLESSFVSEMSVK
jgi:hypothetical protein